MGLVKDGDERLKVAKNVLNLARVLTWLTF